MKVARWIKLGFSLLILSLAGWLLNSNWHEISRAFELPLHIIGLSGFLILVNLLVLAEQVRQCFPGETRLELSSIKWFRYFVAGRLANTVLAESGTIYRAFQLKVSHAILVHQFLAATAFSSWINVLLMTALSVTIVPFSGLFSGLQVHVVLTTLIAFFFLVLFAPGMLNRMFRGRGDRIRRSRLVRFSQQLLEVFKKTGSTSHVIARILILGILGFMVNVCLVYIVADAALGGFTLAGAVFVSLAANLSTLVAITPGNIGIREMAMEGAVQLVGGGVAPGAGVLLSLILRAIGLIIVGPLGGAFLLWENRK